MHLWRRLPALLIFAAFGLQAPVVHAAVVYKWTDADGVVHFSDQPHPGAEKITTAGPASATSAPPPRPAAAAVPAQPQPKKPAARVIYDDFSIISPAPEQMFFATPVSIQLHVQPALDPNHAITLQLNGVTVPNQAPDALSYSLDLPRGAYSLVATITDRTSDESISTDPVTFYVRQPSALSPKH
jgi:hypothetical protein